MKFISARVARLALALVLPAAFATGASAAPCIDGPTQLGNSMGRLGKNCIVDPELLCAAGQTISVDLDKWFENFCWEDDAHNGDCAGLLPHMRDYHGAITCQNVPCC